MIYNLYITYHDKEAGLLLVLARQNVLRISTSHITNDVSVYYPESKMETIAVKNILKIELIEENLDNEEYSQERG